MTRFGIQTWLLMLILGQAAALCTLSCNEESGSENNGGDADSDADSDSDSEVDSDTGSAGDGDVDGDVDGDADGDGDSEIDSDSESDSDSSSDSESDSDDGPQAIIADHHVIKEFEQIPDEWLKKARDNVTLYFVRDDFYGLQLIEGAEWLKKENKSKYDFSIYQGPTVILPQGTGLKIYGGPGEMDDCTDNNCISYTLIPPKCYWADQKCGLDRTDKIVKSDLFTVSMWSWKDEQSNNKKATVEQYLAALEKLEKDNPKVRFVYMTGHSDGTDTPNIEGTLRYNNKLIRDYVEQNGKVLYDFSDIEDHDPDGVRYVTNDRYCVWCKGWCDSHPEDCKSMPEQCSQGWTHSFACVLKIKAFWWLMARLAGWPGVDR